MEIQGTHQFKAPLAKVWDALLDPEVLSKALPGGDQLERVGENDYKAAMNVKVGPVQGRFEGQVTLNDIKEHESYRMKVSGTGAPGFVNGEGTLNLAENEDGTLLTYAGDVQIGGRIAAVGQRLVDSTAKSIIRQGLKALDDQLHGGNASSKSGGSRGGTSKAAQNAEPAQPTPPKPAATSPETAPQAAASTSIPPSPPSSTSATGASSGASSSTSSGTTSMAMGDMAVGVIKDVVQDLVSDYVPREKQPQLFAFIFGALAMLVFVMLVRSVQRD